MVIGFDELVTPMCQLDARVGKGEQGSTVSDMFLNFTAFVEREASSPAVFGMDISRLDLPGVVQKIVTSVPPLRPGAQVLVTPTMRHVALMRRHTELREAMETADLATCGGTPLLRYARFRGCTLPQRITARAIVDELLHRAELAPDHRLFFVLKDERGVEAARSWAAARGLAAEVEVAPAGFGDDHAAAAGLAERVAGFGATILLLDVNAPLGEVFAARHRTRLPEGCWALCVGGAIGAALAPAGSSRLPAHGHTGDRIRRSMGGPARLIGRYCDNLLGFALSAYRELNAPAQTRAKPASDAPNA